MRWPWSKSEEPSNGETIISTSVVTRIQVRELLDKVDSALVRAEKRLGGENHRGT